MPSWLHVYVFCNQIDAIEDSFAGDGDKCFHKESGLVLKNVGSVESNLTERGINLSLNQLINHLTL